MYKYDFLLVGAGLANLTLARLLHDKGYKVLIVLKNLTLGGCCRESNLKGFIKQLYGPHFFNTNHDDVYKFINKYALTHPYFHKVLTYIDGKLIPAPPNLLSIKHVLSRCDYLLFIEYIEWHDMMYKLVSYKTLIESCKNDDKMIKIINKIYLKFFLNYSLKQWGKHYDEIYDTVLNRVPFVLSNDDRYFRNKKYQFMLNKGIQHFMDLLAAGIDIEYGISVNIDNISQYSFKTLVLSCPIDKFCNFLHGAFDGLTVLFKDDSVAIFDTNVPTVNMPNNFDFTRFTVWNNVYHCNWYFNKSYVTYLIPRLYDHTTDELIYYHIPNNRTRVLKYKYLTLIELKFNDVIFNGRLGRTEYLTMDLVINIALNTSKKY